jgi:eukaryotic-like serine/threonine-protein kinase
VLSSSLAARESSRTRFLREARTLASLDHDHIVHVHQVGEEAGVLFLVMQLLKGESLETRLVAAAPLKVAEVLRIGLETAEGLAAAHEVGLIHRDVKPANIWLEDRRDRVKLLDFGLARPVDDEVQLTLQGEIAGTPAYTAPEQARGEPLDARCDLFSLGCVLYRGATGRLPFAGANSLAVLLSIAQETPPSPHSLNPQVPAAVSDLIMRLLEKDPAQRVQSARELVEIIKGLQRDLTEAPEPSPPASAAAPRELPWWQNRVAWLAGSPVALLIPVLLAAVVIFVQTGEGVVRVEINDPGIAVAIKGTNVVLQHADQGKDITLVPGEKTLVVQRGEFTFETDKLTLKKHETVTVRVELLAGEVQVRQGQRLLGRGKLPDPAPAIAPFDAAQARKHQEEWAAYLKVPVEYTNSIGMKFVLIPPGEFQMGSTPEEIEAAMHVIDPEEHWWPRAIHSEAPQHRVRLTKPFFAGVHEVTQQHYAAVMGRNPSVFAPTGSIPELALRIENLDPSTHPVETVSWNEATAFCVKLSELEALAACYTADSPPSILPDSLGYRLPSEAKWEFFCRAGASTRYWVGAEDKDLLRAGWSFHNSGGRTFSLDPKDGLGTERLMAGGRTHSIGELNPNPFGLFDVHGNVWEWVEDWWAPAYEVPNDNVAIDPRGPATGTERVRRGGGWFSHAVACRSAGRLPFAPPRRTTDLGFRVTLSVEAVQRQLSVRVPSRSPGP